MASTTHMDIVNNHLNMINKLYELSIGADNKSIDDIRMLFKFDMMMLFFHDKDNIKLSEDHIMPFGVHMKLIYEVLNDLKNDNKSKKYRKLIEYMDFMNSVNVTDSELKDYGYI